MAAKPLHLIALVLLAGALTFTIFLIMAVFMRPSEETDAPPPQAAAVEDVTIEGECEQLRMETILLIAAEGATCGEAGAACFDLTFDDGPMNCTVRVSTGGLAEIRDAVTEYAQTCPWAQQWCEPGGTLDYDVSN